MRDIEDQIRDLADHSLSLTKPVDFEPGLDAPRPDRRQLWVVAAVVIMLSALSGLWPSREEAIAMLAP